MVSRPRGPRLEPNIGLKLAVNHVTHSARMQALLPLSSRERSLGQVVVAGWLANGTQRDHGNGVVPPP